MEYSEYCYFHERLHQRHKNYRFSKATEETIFPAFGIRLEDAESIQLAISLVNALAIGNLETYRATAILDGLQLASSNIRNLARTDPREIIREIASTPDGLDRVSHSAFLDLATEKEREVVQSPSIPLDNPALPSGK